jgi:hypothetical protein
MPPPAYSFKLRQRAAALIIVLAFVVLLTGLVVAYFSRTATDRQLAQSSFNDTGAELLSRSALDIVVGDFKQEIVNGSSVTSNYYSPTNSQYVVPQRNVAASAGIPNLIRISSGAVALTAPAVDSRASAVTSGPADPANPKRGEITSARWNTHYLIPKANTGDDKTDPVASFTPPDWVIVTRNGPSIQAGIGTGSTALYNPVNTNTNYAIGRYAYAVYDEGGLLDINVAGYPAPTPAGAATPSAYVTDVGRKGVLAFADLKTLPTTPGNTPSPQAINAFVGFRNYATMDYSNTAPTPSGLSFPYSVVTAGKIGPYYLGPSGGSGLIPPWTLASDHIGTSRDFGAVNAVKTGLGASLRTDQNFLTRRELISFRASAGIASVNTLQYLGTFSREKNASTWRAGGITSGPIEANLAAPPTGPGRFYIGNLNSVIPTQNVQDGIGLKWTAKGKGQNTAPGYWTYNGPTNPNALSNIPSFAGGAKHHFFKLLDYAMTGDDSGNDPVTQFITTLSVGASLIDQYDPNNNFAIYSNTGDSTGSTTTAIQTGSSQWAFGMEKNDTNISKVVPTPSPTPIPSPVPSTIFLDHYLDSGAPVIGGRPFRGVGEFSYGIKTNVAGLPTLDFYTWPQAQNPPWGDTPVLDFFSYSKADPVDGGVPVRSGIVSLNTRQAPVLAALISGQLLTETANTTVTSVQATTAANVIVSASAAAPALSRADIVRLASGAITVAPFNATNETKSTIARAFAEVVQTRTWGLLIDLVAQTGRYKPNATSLQNDFIVEGEKRYWLHVAIDRFDGSIVGQQLEEVLE